MFVVCISNTACTAYFVHLVVTLPYIYDFEEFEIPDVIYISEIL